MMNKTSVKELDLDKVPIIDIGALRDGTAPDAVARELYNASTGLGFIYIKNHGIPEEKIDALRNDGLTFFRNDSKQKELVSVSDKHRGWLGYGGAKMKDDAKPDLKESFIWGYEYQSGEVDDHPLRGPNKWPSFIPSFKENALNYFNAADSLAKTLLEGFAIGLNLKSNFFIQNTTRPLSRASLVYYPDQPKKMGDDQFGVSAHTDFGVLTVLCQDSVGGLQIQDSSGEWFHAPPIDGALVVNVADLLSRWTNGVYKSTPHRVVNKSGKERLSIVLAFDPNPETLINPADIFGGNEKSLSDPITCGEYLIWRFGKAFSYRK